MKKIAFMFGAGAEMSYNLPSGGDFALNIFKRDTTESKNVFRRMRESIDSQTSYTSWLPPDYKTKSISAFGRKAFEDIIHGTVEQNRDTIIKRLSTIDELCEAIHEQMATNNIDVSRAFFNITDKTIENSNMGSDIRFNKVFSNGDNTLFTSNYYSACLLAYKRMKQKAHHEAKELGKIISAILQLEIGALGEKLVKNINDGLFEAKDDDLDILDDLGDIIHLDYQAVGLAGFEYLLEANESDTSTDCGIILSFAQKLLQCIYATVLDYKTLIDSNWMYLYQPSKEWGKFCKISIFLLNTQAYMKTLLDNVDTSLDGYYSDIRSAEEKNEIQVTAIGTSNYTNLAESIIGHDVTYLNGSLDMWYDPYLNRIGTKEELDDSEKHIIVPLLFTQSGTKPMISIDMSRKYVDYFNALADSDEICIIGFGFNQDDEHINGMFRELIDRKEKPVTIVMLENQETERQTKNYIAKKLKITKTDNLSIVKVDKDRCRNGVPWIDSFISSLEI